MRKALRRKGIASLLVMFTLTVFLPAGEAHAVRQSDIDGVQRQIEALTVQREQSQAKVDRLQAEQASMLEQKAALDERNQYTLAQIQLINCSQIGQTLV